MTFKKVNENEKYVIYLTAKYMVIYWKTKSEGLWKFQVTS